MANLKLIRQILNNLIDFILTNLELSDANLKVNLSVKEISKFEKH